MWILLAFGVALFDSLKNVVSKFTLKDTNEYVVAWSNSFVSAVLILPIVLFDIPPIKPNFFLGLFVSGTLNVAALVFFMKSIKLSDLSKTVPLTTISPLLLLITSPIIVGEFPKFNGIVGMVLIVIGAYLLNLNGSTKSLNTEEKFWSKFLYPFRLLFKERGSRYMLIVVLLWSITANFDKIGVVNSSALFYSFTIQLYISIFLFLITIGSFGENKKLVARNWKNLFLVGFLATLTIICHMIALTLTIVPYLISIKRTNSILSVIFGRIFFKESNLKERLLAAILMFLGVLLITFG